MQRERHIGVFRRIVARGLQRHLGEGDLVAAGAGHITVFDGRPVKQHPRQLIHPVIMQPAFQHIGEQHGVIHRAERNAVARQNLRVIFGVMQDFKDALFLQHRFEDADRLIDRHLIRRFAIAAIAITAEIERPLRRTRNMGERNVTGARSLDRLVQRERHADQIGAQTVQ